VTLFKKVKKVLENCSLLLHKICGQSHDKAAVMKGKVKGL
jgi:hypothetical protein